MASRKDYPNIIETINDIADEVNSVLDACSKDKYLYSIVLLYSFIENLLKSMVYIKVLWNKSTRILHDEEIKAVRQYCKSLNFFEAQQTAFSLDTIDWKLYRRIGSVRKERNDIIHQFWLYTHRGNRLVLRKKLEKLAGVASDLLGNLNSLAKEVGVVEMIDVFI